MVSKELLEILRCPNCVREKDGNLNLYKDTWLICQDCGRKYPILDDIPVMLIDEGDKWVKTAENATDYSINKTTANVLFLPTTREEKYKGKQVIDALFYRTGDLLSAGLVYAGTAFLAFRPQQFALVNLGLVAVWIALALFVGRRYERLAAATAT